MFLQHQVVPLPVQYADMKIWEAPCNESQNLNVDSRLYRVRTVFEILEGLDNVLNSENLIGHWKYPVESTISFHCSYSNFPYSKILVERLEQQNTCFLHFLSRMKYENHMHSFRP